MANPTTIDCARVPAIDAAVAAAMAADVDFERAVREAGYGLEHRPMTPRQNLLWAVSVFGVNDIEIRSYNVRAPTDMEAIHKVVLMKVRYAAYYNARRIEED